MYNLLNASVARLRKNKIFWGIVIISFSIACLGIWNQKNATNFYTNSNKLLVNYVGIVGIFLAIFISLFVGADYSDGTIRNKVIAGHSRTSIYLSNLTISMISAMIFELTYLITVLVIGTPILSGITIETEKLGFILLDMMMIVIAYSAIFSCIATLCSNITMSTIVCIVLTLIMFVAQIGLEPTANAKEFYTVSTYDEQEGVEQIKKVPNDNYPGETKKKFCQTILYLIPMGQAFELANSIEIPIGTYVIQTSEVKVEYLYLYSLGLTIAISGIGIFLFNKKELK